MTDTEQLPERVDRIERKLDALTEAVDRRFDEVSEQFIEGQAKPPRRRRRVSKKR